MSPMTLGYDMLYAAAGLVSSPIWGYRLIKTGKWRTDWAARLGRCNLAADSKPTMLIHGVSVGEVSAIRLLVDQLKQRSGDQMRLVIAATTNTGADRARDLYEPDVTVVRYPLDFTGSVRRFLDIIKPSVVVQVELEVWPNMIHECTKRNIPVCVINGRLSANSFRNYRRFRALVRPTFARLAAAAVQTETYAQRFLELGVPEQAVHVLDTMKWDTAIIEDDAEGASELAESMGIDRSKPIIVAGSTGPGEERILINTCPASAQLILVPRHPERFNEVAALAPNIVRRTQTNNNTTSARIFLVDTMGELRKAYALADAVFVGRSLGKLGGSDPLEPIALGKPTAIGPCYTNFTDVVDALKAGDGIEATDHPGDFASRMLADKTAAKALADNGRDVIRSRQGATKRHADMLLSQMPNMK